MPLAPGLARLGWLASAFVASGCDGCARARDAIGPGAADRGASSPFALEGTDCSDGLLRCEAGRVLASRRAHVPSGCRDLEGRCACPWDVVLTCPSECSVDGLVLASDDTDAPRQLCAPVAPVAAPSDAAGDDGVCVSEGARCRDGIVTVCAHEGAAGRVVGRCAAGCAPSVAAGVDEPVPPDGALAILCRRSAAERQ